RKPSRGGLTCIEVHTNVRVAHARSQRARVGICALGAGGKLAPRVESTAITEGTEGRKLGDFIVRERLGQGAFGTVYRAEQPALQRDAVIKVLHQRANPRGVERFLREARLASRLDHPYAAHIYAFGAEPDGLRWIAMELVRGTALDQLLRLHGPL